MYVAAYEPGMSGTLTQVRKFLHKFAPRELSPTRLLEKYATDTKKKGAAKLAAVATESNARDAAAQAAYEKQLASIAALAPVGDAVSAPLPFASSPKMAPAMRASGTNYVPYIAGGAVLLALLLLPKRGRR